MAKVRHTHNMKSPPLAALVVGLASLCFGQVAGAQVAPAFIGTWNGTWKTDAREYEARFTITETGGTWQTAASQRSNPCVGREVPMKVNASSPTEVQFTLQFAEVITGCQNARVELQVGPDGKVTGTRGKYELTLTRKP